MLSKQKKLQGISVSYKLPWIGQTLAFGKAPLDFLEKVQNSYHPKKGVSNRTKFFVCLYDYNLH